MLGRKKKPETEVESRSVAKSVASIAVRRRHVQESADTWLGFFTQALDLFADEDTPEFEFGIVTKKARAMADLALAEYEDRWGQL